MINPTRGLCAECEHKTQTKKKLDTLKEKLDNTPFEKHDTQLMTAIECAIDDWIKRSKVRK